MTGLRRLAVAGCVALAGAGGFATAAAFTPSPHNPAAVTLNTTTSEDGSERAHVRFVLPARVTDVQITRPLRRGGRVYSVSFVYCHTTGACKEDRR